MHQNVLVRKNNAKIEKKWGSAHFVTRIGTMAEDATQGTIWLWACIA
jgi:hypothetical protein